MARGLLLLLALLACADAAHSRHRAGRRAAGADQRPPERSLPGHTRFDLERADITAFVEHMARWA